MKLTALLPRNSCNPRLCSKQILTPKGSSHELMKLTFQSYSKDHYSKTTTVLTNYKTSEKEDPDSWKPVQISIANES